VNDSVVLDETYLWESSYENDAVVVTKFNERFSIEWHSPLPNSDRFLSHDERAILSPQERHVLQFLAFVGLNRQSDVWGNKLTFIASTTPQHLTTELS
jgi:hypothetical protein